MNKVHEVVEYAAYQSVRDSVQEPRSDGRWPFKGWDPAPLSRFVVLHHQVVNLLLERIQCTA
jgi:hypothetical protein